MEDIMFYFLIFITYSFVGWIVEVISIFKIKKKYVNRGFLIGPYCPIYGTASLILLLFFKNYFNNPVVLFIIIVFVASVIEYITSYIMEKLFKARWWDYSKKSFNVNGRICLSTSLLFGILGLFVIYIINPFTAALLEKISSNLMIVISSILFVLFIIDNIVSFKVIKNLSIAAISIRKDYTEEISKKVRDIIIKRAKLINRLIKAFPNIKLKK